MDVVEFRRLTARVVATRNSQSRAFLQAFDLAPVAMGRCDALASGRRRLLRAMPARVE